MVIDLHVHPFCKEATVLPDREEGFKRLYDGQRNQARLKQAADLYERFNTISLADIVGEMDQAGVDKACIVAMDMTAGYGVVKITNQDVSRFAAAYPERFIPFASVDPNLGQAAVHDLREAVEDFGCQGLKLVPPLQKFDFSDPTHFPLWEAALELDIPVWTHCSHQLGNPGSDARLSHPMLLEPVALRYPDLRIVLGHCGFPWVWEAWSLVVRHANVYLDVSVYTELYNHFPWDAYIKYGAQDKLLYATDYPAHTWPETMAALKRADIPDEFRKKILGENAQRLLRL